MYYRRYMRFVTPLIFSLVYILQLGGDLLPHSEKPMTKDFQFSHLNLIGRFGTPGSTGNFHPLDTFLQHCSLNAMRLRTNHSVSHMLVEIDGINNELYSVITCGVIA